VITIENDTFLRAARGQRTSRTPIWMMRQAGRVLPEYRAVREKHSFLDVARIPELCAEVSVQPVERLDVDAAILFSDILLPFAAMGIGGWSGHRRFEHERRRRGVRRRPARVRLSRPHRATAAGRRPAIHACERPRRGADRRA
jgi:hypothetical protein